MRFVILRKGKDWQLYLKIEKALFECEVEFNGRNNFQKPIFEL